MKWNKLLFSCALVVAGAIGAACDGSSSDSGPSADAAASEAVKALCAKIASCSNYLLQTTYGDTAACETRLKSVVLSDMRAQGTSLTPSQISDCAKQIPAATCADFPTRNWGEACKSKPGALADGAVCGDGAQCKGRRCSNTTGAACGTCSTIGAAGAACTENDDCENGLTCAGGVCAASGKTGDACDAKKPCQFGLVCKNAACATPTALGQACVAQNECDGVAGQWCNPQSQVCEAVKLAKSSEACGYKDNVLTLCIAGTCDGMDLAQGKLTGTCKAFAPDGATCSATTPCATNARCVNGTCKIEDSAACTSADGG
jgi:hypothetical protein